MKRVLLATGLSTVIFGVALAAVPDIVTLPPQTVVIPDVPDGSTPPSKFGRMTSRRWAHGQKYVRENLDVVPNPHPSPEPHPRRDHPFDVAVLPDGSKAYVTLAGSELEPGNEVAVYDVKRKALTGRILLKPAGEPGPAALSPYRVAVHPGGRFLVVTSRFSNFASVIDSRTDTVVSEIPLDFYCQGLVFTRDGRTAYVANRYLDQVFVVDIVVDGDRFSGTLREQGGMDEKEYAEKVMPRLDARCGAAGCHATSQGGFVIGRDARESFLSTLRHVVPGNSADSRLLRAVTRTREGGFADRMPPFLSHAGGTVVFPSPSEDADFQLVKRWIDSTRIGPGIAVGNPRSKPKIVALSTDERHLFVGNTGTQDVSIVSTETLQEVGGIYIQNVVNDLRVAHLGGRDHLLITTLGVGFGVVKERDPWGAETWDRNNAAAHFTVRRDLQTGRVLPKDQQDPLGPMDAVDGTWAIKFRDIQNDLVVVDTTALDLPVKAPATLSYFARPDRYEAHRGWVRYTSDTAESTWGDIKGDIPPELMRIVGAFPEKAVLVGDRLLVSMQASNEVQELRIDPAAADPGDILVPVRNYPAGLQPIGIAATKDGLAFVANFLSGSLTVIDRSAGTSTEVVIDRTMAARPFPSTNAERGELLAHTAGFSSDGDTSCFHCHYLDMGDGRPWGVSQVVAQEYLKKDDVEGALTIGGTMGVPQMRNLFNIQPFFFEGTLSAFEPRSMIMEHAPADDFAGPVPLGDFTGIEGHAPMFGAADIQSSMGTSTTPQTTLEERRDEMFRQQSLRHFGKAFTLRDFQRFVGEWQINEPRLLPNPFDATSRAALRGRMVFEDPQVGCVSCHVGPDFTRKDFPDNPQQALPPMVTLTPRDAAFTLISMNRLDAINGILRDLEPWDPGRAEDVQGRYTTFPLRGLWDRPPVFLHNGLARTLHEVVCTPAHGALRRYKYEPLIAGFGERPGRREVGFNETMVTLEKNNRVQALIESGGRIGPDTHGGTMHLRPNRVDDLVDYLETIP